MGEALTYCILDTGCYNTVMDTSMATALGLAYRPAEGNNCGTYTVPGMAENNYAGVIEGPVKLTFGPGVTYEL